MLTTDQLKTINHHFHKENWLLNEELIAELSDHYITGLEDRMAHGMTFDNALREIHTGFGGRKGLLQMEEDFQKRQVQSNGRQVRELVSSYFQLRRLWLTALLFLLSYTIIQLLASRSEWLRNSMWLLTIGLISLSALYLFAWIRLINHRQRSSRAKAVKQTIWKLLQGLNSFFMLVVYTQAWLPTNQILVHYPLFASAVVTLFVVFELAVIEQFYKSKKIELT